MKNPAFSASDCSGEVVLLISLTIFKSPLGFNTPYYLNKCRKSGYQFIIHHLQ